MKLSLSDWRMSADESHAVKGEAWKLIGEVDNAIDVPSMFDAAVYAAVRLGLVVPAALAQQAQPEPEDALADRLEQRASNIYAANAGAVAALLREAAAALRSVSQPLTDEMIQAEALHEYGPMENADNITRWSYKSFTDGMKRARDKATITRIT